MGTDVFFSFSTWSSGQPLDLDAILEELEQKTEEDAYHLVFRRGGHLFAIEAKPDVSTEDDLRQPVRRRRHLYVVGAETDVRRHGSSSPRGK